MARLNTYPRVEYVNNEDAFVIDGPQGTRTVSVDTVMNYIPSSYVTDEKLLSTVGSDGDLVNLDFAPYFLKENIVPIISPLGQEELVYTKHVSDLQNNVSILNFKVSGTSKYAEGLTDYSEEADEQEGNFLALAVTLPEQVSGVTMTYSYAGEAKDNEPISDGKVVVRIPNALNKGIITITAKKGTDEYIADYDLSDLTLEEKGEE